MAKTYPYPIRLTAEEKAKLKDLADADYRSMADWLRSRIHIEHSKLEENHRTAEVTAN